MKTVDEHGTTVYFNIPHDAVVAIAKEAIQITVNEKPFMVFCKNDTPIQSDKVFYLSAEEFALLQKEIEQQFAKETTFLGAYVSEEGIKELYK
jgi:hypothetical protein